MADKNFTDLHLEDIDTKGKVIDQDVVIDPALEKKLLRKIDLRLLPPLALLYLCAFLDRTNIGNAKIQGLTQDLHQVGSDYNIALFIFFIPYILFEVPSNIIIKRVRPSTWLSLIMTLWGIVTICQGLVKTQGQLVACRFLLGIFEAGFVPGCTYLISMYYKRHELQWRFNLFFSASIMSGAFSGLLAYAIANMSGISGYKGWRWIFIIEGLATVAIGIASKFFIVDWPEQSKFLTEEERALLLARLHADNGEARMDRLDRAAMKRVFSDWKIYCGVFMYMGVLVTGYAGSFFIPTIIKALGYTSTAAQVRTIPIYIVATACALTTAAITDRLRHRYAFTIIGVLVATVGYALLLVGPRVSTGVQYFALFLVVSGGYIAQPVVIIWIQNSMGGHYKRSVAAAMMIGFGNCGGIVASNVYITTEAPRYPTGYGTSLGMLWMTALLCTAFVLGLRAENRRRDRGARDYRLGQNDADNLGDDHPHFRFMY